MKTITLEQANQNLISYINYTLKALLDGHKDRDKRIAHKVFKKECQCLS